MKVGIFMMTSSNYRAKAREKLAGRWGKVALLTLGYFAIFFVVGFIEGLSTDSLKSIISLAVTIIEIPLSFGFIIALFKFFNGENVKAFDFLSLGFSNFKKSWGVSLHIALKLIVPIILIIVSVILIAFGVAQATTSVLTGGSGLIIH